jgi:hypothetical protein
MKIKFIMPYVLDMGSVEPIIGHSSPNETAEQNALWQFNRMREHDGLKPYAVLPAGTNKDYAHGLDV